MAFERSWRFLHQEAFGHWEISQRHPLPLIAADLHDTCLAGWIQPGILHWGRAHSHWQAWHAQRLVQVFSCIVVETVMNTASLLLWQIKTTLMPKYSYFINVGLQSKILIFPFFTGGLLSVIVDAYSNGTLEDALIIPIAINYDRLLDGNFIREQMGQSKVCLTLTYTF